MMNYKLSPDGIGVIRSDGVSFSVGSVGNVDAERFSAWVSAGNAPAPADHIAEHIQVTPWQMREAMVRLGIREAVENAVQSASQSVRDGWEFAQEFRSDNAMIATVAQSLGKSPGDILALFALAQSLTL